MVVVGISGLVMQTVTSALQQNFFINEARLLEDSSTISSSYPEESLEESSTREGSWDGIGQSNSHENKSVSIPKFSLTQQVI